MTNLFRFGSFALTANSGGIARAGRLRAAGLYGGLRSKTENGV